MLHTVGGFNLAFSLGQFTGCTLSLWADFWLLTSWLSLPYFTFGVGRLLYLPSAEDVSVWPNAHSRM